MVEKDLKKHSTGLFFSISLLWHSDKLIVADQILCIEADI